MKYLSLKEVGLRFGYSAERIRQLAKAGKFDYLQIPGGSIHIPEASVDAFVERYTCRAQQKDPGSSASQDAHIGTSPLDDGDVVRALRIGRQLNAS